MKLDAPFTTHPTMEQDDHRESGGRSEPNLRSTQAVAEPTDQVSADPETSQEVLARFPLLRRYWPKDVNKKTMARKATAELVLRRAIPGPASLRLQFSDGTPGRDLCRSDLWGNPDFPSQITVSIEEILQGVVGKDAWMQVSQLAGLLWAKTLGDRNMLCYLKERRYLPAIPGWVYRLKTAGLRQYMAGLWFRNDFLRFASAHRKSQKYIFYKMTPELAALRPPGRLWDTSGLYEDGGRWLIYDGWWVSEDISMEPGREPKTIASLFEDGRLLRQAAELIDPRGRFDRVLFWEAIQALRSKWPVPPRGWPKHDPETMRPFYWTPPGPNASLDHLLDRLRRRAPLPDDPKERTRSLIWKGRLKVTLDELDGRLEELFDRLTLLGHETFTQIAKDLPLPMKFLLLPGAPEVQVTPLETVSLIEAEGRTLRNCLRDRAQGYARRILTGESSLYRLTTGRGERVAVEIDEHGTIEQFYGPRNTEPKVSPAVVHVKPNRDWSMTRGGHGPIQEDVFNSALAIGRLFTDGRPFTDEVRATWAMGPKALRKYLLEVRSWWNKGLPSGVRPRNRRRGPKGIYADPLPPVAGENAQIIRVMDDFALGYEGD